MNVLLMQSFQTPAPVRGTGAQIASANLKFASRKRGEA